MKKLFNEAHNLTKVFPEIKEDPITVFKSQLVAIAAKRRAKARASLDVSQLTKSIDLNTDPDEIKKAKIKKKLYNPMDIKRLTR